MWCDENKMTTNDDKTKSMLITMYQKFQKPPVKQLHVFIRDHKLEVVGLETLLGGKYKPKLNLVVPCRHFITVSMALARIRQIKPFLTLN